MLDIILIQHIETGINLLEYRQSDTKFNSEHSDIFAGFMSAIQTITNELNIGVVVLISTEGTKGHNCIIVHQHPINVIILADREDPIELWREQGEMIAEKFIEKYGNTFNPSHISAFEDFKPLLKEMCTGQRYCE